MNQESQMTHDAEGAGGKPHHMMIRVLLFLLIGWSGLPVLGVGTYRNQSGDLCFDLWYLITFMIIGFFLMHEVITPLPKKGE